MEDNEDEPEDVRKATPVSGAIKSGTKDEKAGNPKATSKKKDESKPSRCDKNAKKPALAKSEADCCRSTITKPPKNQKIMSVMVYSPPCTLPKLEIIPRHCLSKQEYIDVLAAPSRKCPSPCFGKTVVRKIRPISSRMNELAQPARRLIVGTLQERGETLPPEMISNLVKSIEGSACLTPEQAEQYFKDKNRKGDKKCGKKGSTKMQKCKEKSKTQCPSSLDKEAVMCQYMMAERFVKSILQWKCPIPVEEFQDIASVILRRLSFVLEYTPVDGQDIKSQQMRFLADIIGCWISGVLFEVAEEHKKEIEQEHITDDEEDEDEDEDEGVEEPKKPMNEPEEDDDEGEETEKNVGQQEEKETQDSSTQHDKKDEPVVIKTEPDDNNAKELADKLKAQKEAEEQEKARLEAEKKKKQEEEEEKARIEAEKKKQKEMEEAAEKEAKLKKEQLEEEEKKRKEAEEEKKRKEAEEEKKRKEKEAEEEEEKKKKKQQELEDEENKKKKEAEDKKKREEEEAKKKEAEAESQKKKEEEEKLKAVGPNDAIDKIGDGKLFKTDLPFVTFGKILDTMYDMLEEEPEGDETDLIHNRIQRALYEKFSRLIEVETPDDLTENLKDIVDVLSGKVATWIKQLLKDSEVKFMSTHPPEVESKEIRDWGKWIDQVTDRAGDWAEWIHRVVNEAETKSSGNVKRGDWQNWTSDTETNALLWRRYYLETVHQAHHNKMMMADRPVVKTGEKGAFSPTEEEIKNTDLAN